MDDCINEQIRRYFGVDFAKLRLLGITKHAIYTFVRRVQEGQSKASALNGVLQGRTLDEEQLQYVRSVLDRLPIATKRAEAGA